VRSRLVLYRDVVARPLVARSQWSLLSFFSTAAYCLRVGKKPDALFKYLIHSGDFPATLEDEDRTIAALKPHLARERRRTS
jgi:hypothetical protein